MNFRTPSKIFLIASIHLHHAAQISKTGYNIVIAISKILLHPPTQASIFYSKISNMIYFFSTPTHSSFSYATLLLCFLLVLLHRAKIIQSLICARTVRQSQGVCGRRWQSLSKLSITGGSSLVHANKKETLFDYRPYFLSLNIANQWRCNGKIF